MAVSEIKSKIDSSLQSLDGFLICNDEIFSNEEIDIALDSLNEFIGKPICNSVVKMCGTKTSLLRVSGLHFISESVKNILINESFIEAAVSYSNASRLQVLGTQFYYKSSSQIGNDQVGWHRDSDYINFNSKGVFTAWIACSNITETSGPIKYIRGSQYWPSTLFIGNAGNKNLLSDRKRFMADKPSYEWEECPALLKKGACSFHCYDVLHGSESNKSNEPRIGLAITLITEQFEKQGISKDKIVRDLNDQERFPIIYAN